MGFFRRKPRKQKVIQKEDVEATIQQELAPYIKREELQEYLAGIKKDEKKKKLWDALPKRTKIKLLRHLAKKKGEQDGKK